MGLFDLPGPAFAWVDALMRPFLPGTVRLAVWGIVAGAVSMALYAWISPQRRIALGKRAVAEARRRLDQAYDAPFAEARPLMAALLKVAARQVARVTIPAIVASLPLLTLLVWLSGSYGYAPPTAGEVPGVHTTPAGFSARWVPGDPRAPSTGARVIVSDEHGQPVADLPVRAEVSVIHKYRWWNALFGNPGGYLPRDAPVDSLTLELPTPTYLPLGPRWTSGWEAVFFAALVLSSIALKLGLRIE